MNDVKAIKRSTTSGVRLASYLTELISLIDVAPDAGSGATVDDCDDEDEEAGGRKHRSRHSWESRKKRTSKGSVSCCAKRWRRKPK